MSDTRTCVECSSDVDGDGYHVVNLKTDEYVSGPYCSLKCRSVYTATNKEI